MAGLPRNEQIEKEHAEIKKKIIEMMGTQESIDELWKELNGGKEPLQLRMNSEVKALLEM